ncbi:transcription regulator HTH, apses-type DNA-binding domain-containing protein, partial [Lipomyces oligophaga]|uniref:transcription regulator HTH, apses-type DNA-binding domain-containing protein n=1 Tax=Lipomyces oligophaga TaxID=45792 RepID=UPI0034CF649C
MNPVGPPSYMFAPHPQPALPYHMPIPQMLQPHDPTGQYPPPGMKPRVTTTLWEDEGTLCFQVEAKGVCVARREDNDMVNGTKLLNVAGMTRGRRDGILKSEKQRHVVKVGAMHLKGVWIPYDRALDFANKEKIVDLLYPLFVADIKAFLYHPANFARTTQVMAAAERRRLESTQQILQAQQQQQQLLQQQQIPRQPLPLQQQLSQPGQLNQQMS